MNFQRQVGIFDPKKFKDIEVSIIGTGAVGSFIALAVAKMGLSNIHLFDPDMVSEHNLPNQFYRIEDIGKHKVKALAEIIEDFSGVKPEIRSEHYSGAKLKGIVIVAVDSMDARKTIWLLLRRQPLIGLMIDVRMGGEVAWVLAINPGLDREYYEGTLYSSDEALHLACTEQSIIYTVLGTACASSAIVKSYLLNQPIPKELILDFRLGILLKNTK